VSMRPWVSHEGKKGFKGLRSERNDGSIARQDAFRRIQEERAEFVYFLFRQRHWRLSELS